MLGAIPPFAEQDDGLLRFAREIMKNMDASYEDALVRRAKDDDAACFGELFEIHASRALGAAVAILGNRQDAEEAVQDAASEAFRSIRQLRDDAAFGAWFLRIVVNKAIDRLRQRQRELRRVRPLGELDPPARSEDVESRMDVENAVAQLPPEHQAIVRLYYTEGYRTPEIARLLGKPEGTVRRHLSEAYRILRLALGRNDEP